MTAFDFVVIAIIALSALLGWWRGFMYELFSLIGWIAAYVVARTFSAQALPYIPEAVGAVNVRSVVAFAVLFIVTLIVAAIAAWLLARLAKFAGLGGMDGKFGAMFGVLRGVLVAACFGVAGRADQHAAKTMVARCDVEQAATASSAVCQRLCAGKRSAEITD